MTIHRTPQEKRLQEIAEAPSLEKSRDKVSALYDAITTVQADDLACRYFTMNGRISLNSLGRRAGVAVDKMEQEMHYDA